MVDLKKSDIQPTASATFITGSSFTEKAYNDMKAMLSDTVDINKGALPGVTDETTLPISAPPVEAFEVFIDDDETEKPSMLTHDENKSSHPKPFESFEPRPQMERAPFQAIPQQIAVGDSELRSGVKEPKNAANEMNRYEDPFGFKKPFVIEDEETMAGAKFTSLGIHKKLDRGIVTSTPAHQMVHPPTHEDFFAPLNQQLAEEMKEEEDDEELYAQSAFMRRRSVAPPKSVLAASKVAVAKPRTVQAAERSMELALDKMNLGGAQEDEVKNVSDECDDHNRTGVGLVKESVTSAVNPWDRQLRMEIMRRSVVPTYQHNFDIACPRVCAGKTINFGGEDVLIATLIGQGGFAKVYKYEVPSCPWEVYICSEVKQRLGTSKQFTLDSVMQVDIRTQFRFILFACAPTLTQMERPSTCYPIAHPSVSGGKIRRRSALDALATPGLPASDILGQTRSAGLPRDQRRTRRNVAYQRVVSVWMYYNVQVSVGPSRRFRLSQDGHR
ncbi:unnamed protein product [Heligmosomoides polygyrus]|uniref:Uncharacterized protein n=1 Tax=Heligmosomoides polygyrus TaxID=6339 RepID=A0A3P7XPB7_HELPZ|nr:unnamed protein product [Heligmosomoides polygyrus]